MTPRPTSVRRQSAFLAWLGFLTLLLVTISVCDLQPLHGQEQKKKKKKKSPNLEIPKDLDEKKADVLRGLADDFRRAQEVSTSGKPMVDMANRLKKASKRIDVPLIHFYLGWSYQYLRQFDRAIESFDTCLAGNPKFHEAHTHRAQVLYRKHDFVNALAGFEAATQVLPSHAVAFDGASRSALRLGRVTEAIAYAQKAQEAGAEDSDEVYEDRADYLKQLEAFVAGPGWDETHTAQSDHFSIKTDLSQKRAERTLEEAEAAHRLFCRAYPIFERRFGDDKLQVMLFGTQDAYRAAGAFGEDDGFYNPLFQQLNIQHSKRSEGVVDALKGQGFIQHAHHIADDVPYWFQQGNRLYFRAALLELVDDKEFWIRPPQGTFKAAIGTIRRGRLTPIRDLMIMEQEEFEQEPAHLHQSWSIVYFCLQSGSKKYRRTLLNYFEMLADGKSPSQAYDGSFGKIQEKRFVDDMKKYICDKLPKLVQG